MPQSFAGPAMHNFFEKDIVGNPLDDNFSRYLKFSPSCSYFAYDITYPSSRTADEHYEKSLRQAMMYTISRFRIDEVMAAASREASRPRSRKWRSRSSSPCTSERPPPLRPRPRVGPEAR